LPFADCKPARSDSGEDAGVLLNSVICTVSVKTAKPENEDEKNEQRQEGGYVVERSQHDFELVLKSGQEANELEYTQQSECSKYRQTAGAALDQLHQADADNTRPTQLRN